MKKIYIQLILSVGMIGFVMSALSIELDLSKGTMKKFGETGQEAIKKAIEDFKLAPIAQQVDELVTPERAIRYGSFLSLMLALPYSSRLAWNMLEKSLLNTNPSLVNAQTDSIFSSAGAIRYGSLAALMLTLPYSSRFLWNILEKKLFKPGVISIDEQVQPK